MLYQLLQTLVNVLVALLVSLTALRHEQSKKLTISAYAVIALSIVGACLSLYDMRHQSVQGELARYRLSESDIQLHLTATVVGEAPSVGLEKLSPSAIQVSLIAPREGGGWTCILEPLTGFVSSGYSRGAPSSQRIYVTRLTRAMGEIPYKYLWDLDGKTFLILRNPRYQFSAKEWRVEVELRVRGRPFRGESDGQGLRFKLRNLSRDALAGES